MTNMYNANSIIYYFVSLEDCQVYKINTSDLGRPFEDKGKSPNLNVPQRLISPDLVSS